MNIMAQVPLEKKINMSYSAEELLVTCLFDGVSCDARSGQESALLALSPLPAPAAQLGRAWEGKVLFSLTPPFGKKLTWELGSRVSEEDRDGVESK